MGKKEIEFKCPRCGGKAYYYPSTFQAGCIIHGWLLYTEIPQEIRTPPNKTSTCSVGQGSGVVRCWRLEADPLRRCPAGPVCRVDPVETDGLAAGSGGVADEPLCHTGYYCFR